jgi:hypothetical protein
VLAAAGTHRIDNGTTKVDMVISKQTSTYDYNFKTNKYNLEISLFCLFLVQELPLHTGLNAVGVQGSSAVG